MLRQHFVFLLFLVCRNPSILAQTDVDNTDFLSFLKGLWCLIFVVNFKKTTASPALNVLGIHCQFFTIWLLILRVLTVLRFSTSAFSRFCLVTYHSYRKSSNIYFIKGYYSRGRLFEGAIMQGATINSRSNCGKPWLLWRKYITKPLNTWFRAFQLLFR